MTKHTTNTAAVAVGAMLFDVWFDPIEDARGGAAAARRRCEKFFVRALFGCVAGNCLMLALIAPEAGPSMQTHLSVLAMLLMVAYG
jgi:hypothetical protein